MTSTMQLSVLIYSPETETDGHSPSCQVNVENEEKEAPEVLEDLNEEVPPERQRWAKRR